MTVDGTCFIEPKLMSQNVNALASRRQIMDAADEIITDCVDYSEGVGGSTPDIGKP